MAYFNKARNLERSIIEYFKSEFASKWPELSMSIVKGFNNSLKTELPLITVELEDVDYGYIEVGSTGINKIYYFNVNLFARNDGEKLDIVDFLYDIIKEGCPYLEAEYESGGFTTVVTTQNGRARLKVESSSNLQVDTAGNSKDKYRYYIQVSARKF